MQPTRALRPLLLAALAVLALPGGAQVVAVDQVESGFLIKSEPTLTLLREAPNARRVLIVMPGGEGRINLKAGASPNRDATPRSSFGWIVNRLTDPAHTSASTHVVVVDSPYPLGYAAQIPARGSRDHLVRMLSVVQSYRDRYQLPVAIMGHSNGGYSIAEFLRYLHENKKEGVLSGLVFSAGRIMSNLGDAANLPALFITPERDGCASTSHAGNQRLYEKFKAVNKAATEFVAIKGGEPEADPCQSGVHMYHMAHDEAAAAIDAFLTRHVAPPAVAR
jgi:hypothetical protein